MSACPRVLIINYRALNRTFAAGITVSSFFAGWPQDCIAQVFVDDEGLDTSVCERHWQLKPGDLRSPLSLHRVAGAWKGQLGKTRLAPRFPNGGIPGETSGRPGTILDKARAAIRSAVGFYFTGSASYGLSMGLRQWIDDFKPDAIYSILEDFRITAFVKKVSQTYRILIVPHFMDDWITSSISGNAQEGRLGKRLLKYALEIMAQAPVRMVIGDAMEKEYGRRYGMTFLPFMNCVEAGHCGAPKREPGGQFVFTYCGGLHLNRWRQLVDIGHALDELRAVNIGAELHVVSRGAPDAVMRELAAINSIRCLGSLPFDEVSDAMSAADCLVHVESFEETSRPYVKYSLSAKLPEYFCAGRPILAYGPGDVASIQYIQQEGAGLVVTESGSAALRDALQRLIQDGDLRIALGERARRLARERHDAAKVRSEFRHAIEAAVCRAG